MAKDLSAVSFATRDPQDEIALARLGAAAVVAWYRLPADARERLLFFSTTLDGLPTLPDGGERIARLIEANAGNPDR